MYENNFKKQVRQRAQEMAIETGKMANIDLIWMHQESEKQVPCFGQGHNCHQSDCKWIQQCITLTNYKPQANQKPQRLIA